jgi:ribose 5-phosphate isomerase RpiB
MRVGIAADHGGFELKAYLITTLKAQDMKWQTTARMKWIQEMTTQIL